MTDRKLTMSEAMKLGEVIDAAVHGSTVAFYDPDVDTEPEYGTARHIVKDPVNIGFLGRDDDVRDAYLRVTMLSGFERFELVSDLIDDLGEAFFVNVSVPA